MASGFDRPLGWVKRKLKGPFERVQHKLLGDIENQLRRVNSQLERVDVVNIIKDCVSNKEHRELLYALVQLGAQVVVDSRKSCVDAVDAYLNRIRPVALSNLIRVGGALDGGYVMYPPPPTAQCATKGYLFRGGRLFSMGFRNGAHGLFGPPV
ncbi:hypothetical protein [Helicobacter vulpis]|uniref:hypothetical protein n=1 Tax=Helicobacter vulpis TaxID=2316076 RepID=UPI000EAE6B69|nr:hypothetical protein [Helicobacter vulpis]